ncbi:acyl-CoA thioesterase [Haloplanus aerogenes]|uniref:Acyl-CoA thioester hydrolase n=1 Tax=Haloplanus aerogenes TaxID=660522 RepID=A0A3M0DPV9_9EURY|nr:thioesterase family protein [Haloplanus aerogenes]AZH24717.1 acyl-CoA thioesterase [Haloplanus aerogenes]RMB23625.1 acyl-CoA thioester hydrolase [Haloplanus aerogenes]
MTDFEYETELQVRFRDLDAMGHVNNAVYATYLEQARVDYYDEILGVGLDDIDTVLVNLQIDYRHEVKLDDETVTIAMGVRDIGRSSVTVAYEMRAGGQVAATAETTQVYVDPEEGGSRPLPEAWVEKMESLRS